MGKFHNDSLIWTEEIKKTEDKGNDQLPKVISSGHFFQLGMVQMRHTRKTASVLQSHCLMGQLDCKESDLNLDGGTMLSRNELYPLKSPGREERIRVLILHHLDFSKNISPIK